MKHVIFPTSAQDYPYQAVTNGVTLWRYLDARKFEHLLTSRALWFSRIDQFRDQLEGTKPEHAPDSPGEQNFFEAAGVSGWADQSDGASQLQRATKFGICWHMNLKENSRMWHEYTPHCPCAVAIVGSVKSIRRGFRDAGRPLIYSPVQYLTSAEPHPQLDHDSIFFYKNRELYSHEKEYRILTSLMGSELPFRLEGDESRRRIVPFNTKVGIKRIVFHPDAPESFKKNIRRRFRQVFASVKQIENSTL